MQKMANFFDRIMRQYTPDPFVIAIALSAIVIILASLTTPHSTGEVLHQWGSGFWNLITFTLQMAMILLGGYVMATSKPVQWLLHRLAQSVRSPVMAIALATFVAGIASWLNWGLGLVVGAFFAIELAKAHPGINFRLLVASSYSGFLLWHGGLSGSIPLLLNTKGNFTEDLMGGRIIPLSDTLFSPFNLVVLASLFVLLPLLNSLMAKPEDPQTFLFTNEPEEQDRVAETFADRLDDSPVVTIVLAAMGLGFLMQQVLRGEFALDLNRINFLFFFIGLLLHWRPRRFLVAALEGAKKTGPILIQYPLYAGIMGVMVKSGLADSMSQVFVNVANAKTLPLLTFFSAGLVNFFVPSGGGQWAVQAPVVIPAAQQLGADIPLTAMAVAWGDSWTNLAQPFWALPLLAIAGLKIRDIMGYCLMALLFSGLILSVGLLIFA
ncbi:MAG: short-chain fatty acid transporter [Bdellovibrionaceae bacterium]|nr:short-chain fatty acid transporter [Pseudobdellovibrionaceae bacterium]